MKKLLAGLTSLCLCFTLFAQSSIPPLEGWKMEEHGGHYHFTPSVPTDLDYELFPPVKGNGDLPVWVVSTGGKDLQTLGYTPVGSPKTTTVNGCSAYSTLVKDKQGMNKLVIYMAYLLPDHTVRCGKIMRGSDARSGTYVNPAVKHFAALCKREAAAGGMGTTVPGGSTGATRPAGVTGTAGTSPNNTTAPGQGLKPSQIKGIVIHQETGIGVGGMMIIKWRPYLLLQDGSLYSHPAVSPYDLDVASSRRTESKQWGTWKLEGKTLVVLRYGDKEPQRWDGKWQWTTPAEKGEKIAGDFYSISGGGNTAMGGGAMVASSNNISFNKKGQFTRVSTGGGTFSGAGGAVSAWSDKAGAGTYLFDGYSLELHYNNGTVSRQCFYFYPDSKTVFGLGDRDFVPSKD